MFNVIYGGGGEGRYCNGMFVYDYDELNKILFPYSKKPRRFFGDEEFLIKLEELLEEYKDDIFILQVDSDFSIHTNVFSIYRNEDAYYNLNMNFYRRLIIILNNYLPLLRQLELLWMFGVFADEDKDKTIPIYTHINYENTYARYFIFYAYNNNIDPNLVPPGSFFQEGNMSSLYATTRYFEEDSEDEDFDYYEDPNAIDILDLLGLCAQEKSANLSVFGKNGKKRGKKR
jgi:hypothetical protein